MRLKTGDTVLVISGKWKGKKGKVIKALRQSESVLVEGVNLVKKHQKPTQKLQQGGIIEREAPIRACKVMLVCGNCGKPTRVGVRLLEGAKKVRFCKKCGEVIDK
ncbi:MAG TPA: 50S ribosomal protein L24 [Firmicutes bacterium]|nr:50S ribosomal protein L24 [Bacillota bacterium]